MSCRLLLPGSRQLDEHQHERTITIARPEDRALLASNPSAVRGRSMPAVFFPMVDTAGCSSPQTCFGPKRQTHRRATIRYPNRSDICLDLTRLLRETAFFCGRFIRLNCYLNSISGSDC